MCHIPQCFAAYGLRTAWLHNGRRKARKKMWHVDKYPQMWKVLRDRSVFVQSNHTDNKTKKCCRQIKQLSSCTEGVNSLWFAAHSRDKTSWVTSGSLQPSTKAEYAKYGIYKSVSRQGAGPLPEPSSPATAKFISAFKGTTTFRLPGDSAGFESLIIVVLG